MRHLKDGWAYGPARKPFVSSATKESLARFAELSGVAVLLIFLLAAAPWWLAILVLLVTEIWYFGRDWLT